MTKSTGQRRFHYKDVIPADPQVKSISQWPAINRGFYERFREWLKNGGYSLSVLHVYGVAARLTIGYLNKPYTEIDPAADLDRVRKYMTERFPCESTRCEYNKGLLKLAQFMSTRKPKTTQDVNWEYYTANLPTWLREQLREYLAFRRKGWRPEQYYKSTRELLSELTISLRWMAGHAALNSMEDLTPQLWFDYLESRLSAGIAPVTVNSDLHRLQGFITYLDSAGVSIFPRILLVDPIFEGIHIPRDAPPEQLRLVFQEINKEAQSSEAHIRRMGLMDKAWFLLMLHAGLRTGEVRRLKEADIEWERRKVRINQSKGLKDRFVYLSQAASGALQAYLHVRGTGFPNPEYLFVYRHEPLGSRYCQIRLNTYGSRCGVRFTPHQLRHSCATLLLNAGAPVVTVQSILGHKRIDTTLNYARLYDGTIAADYYEAMARVENRLSLELGGNSSQNDFQGEILSMIDALQEDPLNSNQVNILQDLKLKLFTFNILDVKVPVPVG